MFKIILTGFALGIMPILGIDSSNVRAEITLRIKTIRRIDSSNVREIILRIRTIWGDSLAHLSFSLATLK